MAGLKAARARGRKGGRKFALSKAQVRLAQAAMAHRDTSVSELCRELGIRPVTLYQVRRTQGQLREQGQKVLASFHGDGIGSGLPRRIRVARGAHPYGASRRRDDHVAALAARGRSLFAELAYSSSLAMSD